MALDPRIILGGQQLDVMGAMSAGLEQAQNQLAFDRQNALQDLYRTQGAQIMAGDQAALNQLAQFDPMAAMDVQGVFLDRERQARQDARTAVTDSRADQEWEWQVEEYKKGITAEQAAAEAAKIEEAVKMGLMAQTPEQWDALMGQLGQSDLVGQFGNREAIAGRYMSIADVLKRNEPTEWRAATPEEAAAYGAASGQINNRTGQFQKTGDGNGISYTTTNPDGTSTTVQIGGKGGAGGGKPLTEAQSKDNVYATRANGALQKLESPIDPNNPDSPTFAGTLSDRSGVVGDMLSGATLGYSREMMQSPEYQTARTAGDEFLQAILRKDTGAAITAPEQELYGKTYLPQPGDSQQQLAFKAEARKRAVAALQSGMSLEQLEMVTRALAMGDVATADSILQSGAPDPASAAPAAPAKPAAEMSDDEFLKAMGLE